MSLLLVTRSPHHQVNQRLWPQCQTCYSVQGAAVRTWSHLPIYHSAFKLHHLSPAVGALFDQNEEVRKSADDLFEPVAGLAQRVIKEVKYRLGK